MIAPSDAGFDPYQSKGYSMRVSGDPGRAVKQHPREPQPAPIAPGRPGANGCGELVSYFDRSTKLQLREHHRAMALLHLLRDLGRGHDRQAVVPRREHRDRDRPIARARGSCPALLVSAYILVGACTPGPEVDPTDVAVVSASPAVSAAAVPVHSDAPSQTVAPSMRTSLGHSNEAIFVRQIPPDVSEPETIEVSLVTLDATAFKTQPSPTVIARVPLRLPPQSWLDQPRVRVSRTGWLAMSFRSGPTYDESTDGVLFVDLLHPELESWTVEESLFRSAWGPDDQLLVLEPATTARDHPLTLVFTPASRSTLEIPTGLDVSPMPAWLADGSGVIATRTGVEQDEFGVMSLDGRFRSLDDADELPPLYASTGLERPAGRGLRTAGVGCDASGVVGGGGCSLNIEDDDGETQFGWGREGKGRGVPSGFAWDAGGQGLWAVFIGEAGGDRSDIALGHVMGPDELTDIGTAIVDRPFYESKDLLGISGDWHGIRGSQLFLIGEDDRVYLVFAGDGSSATFTGDALFAGWAGDPGEYNPTGR